MPFEPVTLDGLRGRPRITLRKNKQIGFNSTFVENNNLNSCKYAKIFFDKEERKIGFQFTKENDGTNCSEIIFHKKNTYISAKPLFYKFNINPDKGDFAGEAIFDDTLKMFVVKVETTKKE